MIRVLEKEIRKLTVYCSIAAIVMLCAAGSLRADGTVIDSLGRTVTLPAECKRIACLYAFSGHVVAMLGRADAIVAVSNGLKRDVLLTDMYPAIRRAVVPKYQGAINIEELVTVSPDIVFVTAETGRNAAEASKLDAFGIAWIVVDFHSMREQQRVIRMIGQAIGSEEKAVAYNTYYRGCIDRVQAALAGSATDERVTVYHATVEATRTSVRNSLSTDWVHTLGVENVVERDSGWLLDGGHHVSIEQILLWNPDVILANEPGVTAQIRTEPRWSAMRAVQTGRVYQLPIGISRWGHPGSLETPLAILWTAKTIFPQRFPSLDIEEETRGFYENFFGYDVSDKKIQEILSGRGMRLTKNRKKKQR
jgi:iron complex transport system substrate-binding protein